MKILVFSKKNPQITNLFFWGGGEGISRKIKKKLKKINSAYAYLRGQP
jgi:hypothetical protein